MKYFAITLLFSGLIAADSDFNFSFMTARTGPEVYEAFCQSCHGENGRGASPETNLYANRRRLRTADSELITSILEGKGEMSGYSNILTYEEAENVLNYIREDLKRR
jgi:mono/diheme cytochrome c family protein